MHFAGCRRFWYWALAGWLVTFSLVAAASIGLFVLPVAALVTVLVARSTRSRAEALGALVGAGGVCFVIAWIQRGPEGFDARSWLAAGIALTAVGLAGYSVATRRLAPRA
jgi:hypothetical protein